MVRDYRYCCNQYHVEGRWWDFVEHYKECLQSVGIYFSANWLSRKVQEHLKRPRNVTLLNYPDLSTFLESTPDEWAEQFQVNNELWFSDLGNFKDQWQTSVHEHWSDYQHAQEIGNDEKARWHRTKLRFTIYRLAYFGFESSASSICRMLLEPGLISKPHWILEQMAYQGHSEAILSFWNDISELDYRQGGYLRAVTLRAFRFFVDLEQHIDEIATYLNQGVFSGRLPEQLMATETLLAIGCINGFNYDRISQLLDSQRKNPRLIRNLLLILGRCYKHDLNRDYQSLQTSDSTLWNAYDIADNGNVEAIWEFHEPSIIRDHYYSDEYPDFETENEPPS
jgi:hypothetical protein